MFGGAATWSGGEMSPGEDKETELERIKQNKAKPALRDRTCDLPVKPAELIARQLGS